jgi:hypothetical protein
MISYYWWMIYEALLLPWRFPYVCMMLCWWIAWVAIGCILYIIMLLNNNVCVFLSSVETRRELGPLAGSRNIRFKETQPDRKFLSSFGRSHLSNAQVNDESSHAEPTLSFMRKTWTAFFAFHRYFERAVEIPVALLGLFLQTFRYLVQTQQDIRT